jgi:DNA-binding FrmR family transcriptional regulator
MSHAQIQHVLIRLAQTEQHLQGIIRMVQEGQSYPDVLRQIAAVRSALGQVAQLLLRDYATDRLPHLIQQEHLEAELDELLSALERLI